MNQRILTMAAVGALVASMALAGCSKTEHQDAKKATSDAMATAEQKAKEVGSEAAAGLCRCSGWVRSRRILRR